MVFILGIFSRNRRSLIFGPTAINALSRHAHDLVHALKTERIYIDNQGRWQDVESPAYWCYAYFVVAIRSALGPEYVTHIEAKSGLAFEQFLGQVILWWLPQRRRVGLLRAVAHRLDAHGIELTLHWNLSKPIRPTFRRPPLSLQITVTLASFLLGIFLYQQLNLDQLFGFLCAGVGYVGSEIYRRSRYYVFCGDPLCRSRIKGRICDFCGADAMGEEP